MSESEAGPSHPPIQRPSTTSRRRSSGARSGRSRLSRSRAASSLSVRSDSSNVSSGVHRLSWITGDCFDYVDQDAPISAFLHCPICLGPFLDPYVSDNCSHTFCRHCISVALSSDSNDPQGDDDLANKLRCPTCRTSVKLDDFKPTALLIKNMVDTLHVRCPNKSKGCTYVCERHLLKSHVARDCEYEYVDQDLNEGRRCGCSEKVMRKDWAAHGLVCPKRKVRCSTCDLELQADELHEHCKICSPEPVRCQFCHLDTIESRLPLHLEECLHAPVPCKHAAFGCAWKGPRWQLTLQRSESHTTGSNTYHLEQCPFEPLKAFFAVFTQHTSQLKDENANLRRRLDELEARQRSQHRRTDDCIHSLGSWYRSAGAVRNSASEDGPREPRRSHLGVDGEWDEFPLDAQNWERSFSQTSLSHRHQGRSQSASAATMPDMAEWMAQQPQTAYSFEARSIDRDPSFSPQASRSASSYFPSLQDEAQIPPSSSRYLIPPTSRSMPTSSPIETTSTSRSALATDRRSSNDAPQQRSHRRSFTTSPTATRESTHISNLVGDLDRTNLDAAVSSLNSSLVGLSIGLSNLDKRSEEGHLTAVKAGFDATRAQEEVASLRHALHAVRMQIHQMLMQQQRYAMFSPPTSTSLQTGNDAGPSNSLPALQTPLRDPTLPILTPPLFMRRFGGFEQTKL